MYSDKPKKPKGRQSKLSRKNAVIDYETDPFLYGRIPKPFCVGFYSEEIGFKYFWGDDCVFALLCFLDTIEPHLIWAHNGGKFDFFLMLEHLENPLKIINGRIVKAKLGKHELQDSYAILPIPLRIFDKGEIDYEKMERENRDQNKEEIISYLSRDCISLFNLVCAFIVRFGVRLTIGGTAIKELKKHHPFESQKKNHDEKFRPYYFGGRVQAFKTGIIPGDWRVYDVNSMYPYVMREFQHPTGSAYVSGFDCEIDNAGNISGFEEYPVYFARIHCRQSGAFPIREKDAPLNFDLPEGEFFVTSHELKAAFDTGRVSDVRVIECLAPLETINFAAYVDLYSGEKIAAKQSKDKAGEIFAKLLLNSAYGKFGQNPEHYFDYLIDQNGDADELGDEYEIYYAAPNRPRIWRKPSPSQAFYDVATAASITGAARAMLMRGLAHAKSPVYCDTDSIICESLDLEIHDSKLGSWKLEATGDKIAIVGKKLYALKNKKEYVKTASKGVILTGAEIFSLCKGKTIHWHNQAPSFSLAKGISFVDRRISKKENLKFEIL